MRTFTEHAGALGRRGRRLMLIVLLAGQFMAPL